MIAENLSTQDMRSLGNPSSKHGVAWPPILTHCTFGDEASQVGSGEGGWLVAAFEPVRGESEG